MRFVKKNDDEGIIRKMRWLIVQIWVNLGVEFVN